VDQEAAGNDGSAAKPRGVGSVMGDAFGTVAKKLSAGAKAVSSGVASGARQVSGSVVRALKATEHTCPRCRHTQNGGSECQLCTMKHSMAQFVRR